MINNNLESLTKSEIFFVFNHLQHKSYFLTQLIANKHRSCNSLDLAFISKEAVSESLKSLLTSKNQYDSTLPIFQKKAFLTRLLQQRIYDQIRTRTKFFFMTVSNQSPIITDSVTPLNYATKEDRRRLKRRRQTKAITAA